MEYVRIEKLYLESEIIMCHKELAYWEEQYRNARENNDIFYKKSYLRKIYMLQARLDTLREMLNNGDKREE